LLPLLLLTETALARDRPREERHRTLALTGESAEPVEELHVAGGVSTTVDFAPAIDPASVELEGRTQRFRRVDLSEHRLVLEPLADLAPGERLLLRARFREAGFPALAEFALVSPPSEVDVRVEVLRPRSVEELQAELATLQAENEALRVRSESPHPEDVLKHGWENERDMQVRKFAPRTMSSRESGLLAPRGVGYRASDRAVVTLQVRNLPGQEPWKPGSAWLIGASGAREQARSVRLDRLQLTAGEQGFLFVELGALPPDERFFRLELVDQEGQRRLLLDRVKLPGRSTGTPGETP